MITVLGKTFSTEEERRTYFREELRKKLPELKQMEGFPIGEDEDILNLSDPPYYTACPNPWLNDFIAEWEEEKKALEKKGLRKKNFEVTEPYAADVSEGKSDAVYTAHTYHTKVPHLAIMRYLLHYTQPGDIVFDGFAGTGMTGVAASMCSKPNINFKQSYANIEKNNLWGKRNSICSDLSPYASLISNGYNTQVNNELFEARCTKVIDELESKYSWFYLTNIGKNTYAKVMYILWSEVLECASCGNQREKWKPSETDTYYDLENEPSCQICNAKGEKNFSAVMNTVFDKVTNTSIEEKKYNPVLINYFHKGKRGYKIPSGEDLKIIQNSNQILNNFIDFVPKIKIGEGDKTNELLRDNYKYAHQLFTPRNLLILILLWKKLDFERGKMLVTSTLSKTSSILHNVGFKKGKINLAGALPNALYVPGVYAERNLFELHRSKLKDLSFDGVNSRGIVQVASATSLNSIPDNCIDYIFTDPPFGANLMYSELNLIHEGWIKVRTNNKKEAIVNKTQNKNKNEYLQLMTNSFLEYYRILKPNSWMTVEFNSTKSDIWNIIQTSLVRSGFIITSVNSLNKGQGTFNSQTNPTSVKQDLIISCYKESDDFKNKFEDIKSTRYGVVEFIKNHLEHLPIHFIFENKTKSIFERNSKILYDRLVAYYVQRSLMVPVDSSKFQKVLRDEFVERDGMFFTPEQAEEYDRKKAAAPNFVQLDIFVTSEREAILWLKNILEKEPQTEQDLHPKWMKEVAGNMHKGDTLPEMRTILEENFLKNDSGQWYLPDPENEADKEEQRTKRLLKQFKALLTEIRTSKKKIKEVRVEAVRAGFTQCYKEKDFKTIVEVGERIPEKLLMEDEMLLQFFDIADGKA